MTSRRRVVVTGIGATSPLGGDAKTTWENALAGVSGAATFTGDWVGKQELPVTFGCQLKVPTAEVLSRPETRRLDPAGQAALVASREAWQDAGTPEVDPLRLGVVLGTGIGGVWTLLDQWDIMQEKGARRVNPLTVPMLMANSAAAHVELELGALAGAHCPVSACASGAEALAYAVDMIRAGRADVIVAGGTEAAIHPLPIAAFANMRALSTRNDAPELASRPYDTDRDGFVLGEGAGVMVLEAEEYAKARGATIYGYVDGVGMSSDAHHIAAPTPDGSGPGRAMLTAVADAGIDAKDIVHINAHATSTPAGDGAEATAIRYAFADEADHMLVSGTKSMTGHLLGGAGALESIFTVLALRDRVAPPTINIDNLDASIPLNVVANVKQDLPEGDIAALNNAFGFGGHNVSIVFTTR
ncbi:beta-ketoacyl-ACP synthase II [Micrococcales bacterium 31B]|nr:beta-ketoacyl-ACP synthase II [Micrococcales bacterium 31B]